jgi:sigma-E factor negative regulatory protein RseC
MENTVDCVKHSGVVERITSKIVYVRILQMAACASCNAKGMCNTAEMEEKTIEVINDGKERKVGEHVMVVMDKKLGPQAVRLGYIYPFLTLLITLIISLQLTGNEGISALIALASIFPYYAYLYLNKDRFKKKFTFRIE